MNFTVNKQLLRKYGFLASFAVFTTSMACADIPSELTTAADNIYSIFDSGVVKTLLLIAFCGLVIMLVLNWDAKGAKVKFGLWIIAVIALMNAESILAFLGWEN